MILMLFLVACGKPSLPTSYTAVDAEPSIWPDYKDVTVPPNIAPLNFMVDSVEDVVAEISMVNGQCSMTYGGKEGKVQFDEKEWREMLASAKGKSLSVSVYTKKDGKWLAYKPDLNMICTM